MPHIETSSLYVLIDDAHQHGGGKPEIILSEVSNIRSYSELSLRSLSRPILFLRDRVTKKVSGVILIKERLPRINFEKLTQFLKQYPESVGLIIGPLWARYGYSNDAMNPYSTYLYIDTLLGSVQKIIKDPQYSLRSPSQELSA